MKGYKHTELGWIPVDWDYDYLDLFAKRGTGHTPDKKKSEYHNGKIPWISLADSNKLDNIFIDKTKYSITEEGLNNSSAVLHSKGTVVLSRDAGVGKSAIMGSDMAVSQHFVAWTCNGKLDNLFLYYFLQSRKYEFERIAIGSTIKTIGMPYFEKLKISAPKLKEQKKISKILFTWDKSIETLTQLIAAKQQLKKGLMQQLLTGKKRLPRFRGKWKFKSLGEILRYEQPTKYIVESTEYDNTNGTAVLTANKSFILGYTSEKGGIFQDLPVIIFDDFTTLSKFVTFPFKVKSSALKILKLSNKSFDLKFIFERMQLIEHSSGDHKRYWISEFQDKEVEFPNIDEQIAISKVSTVLDKEIESLNIQLELFKQQKQGLMQQLLTGKKRVKL